MAEVIDFRSRDQLKVENGRKSFDLMRKDVEEILTAENTKLAILLYATNEPGHTGVVVGGKYDPEKIALLLLNAQELKYLDWGRTMSEQDLDVLARTLWGEARGEGEQGMQAVACVVLNRAAKKGWMGKTVSEVCLKPWQFSCWNADDPNREKLLKVGPSDPQFKIALQVATDALAGRLKDYTFGSTHYHTLSIAPKWAKGKTPVVVIGNHAFYNDVK